MIDEIILVCAGLLPLAVLFSGIYDWPTQGIAMVTANVGLLVGILALYLRGGSVPAVLRWLLYAVVVVSLLYHVGAAVRTRQWTESV